MDLDWSCFFRLIDWVVYLLDWMVLGEFDRLNCVVCEFNLFNFFWFLVIWFFFEIIEIWGCEFFLIELDLCFDKDLLKWWKVDLSIVEIVCWFLINFCLMFGLGESLWICYFMESVINLLLFCLGVWKFWFFGLMGILVCY